MGVAMGLRRLPLLLPADLYKRLADVAKAEDRDPLQQARVILRQVLTPAEPPKDGKAP